MAAEHFPGGATRERPSIITRLWDRKVHHYPAERQRVGYLAIVVLTTIALYYEFYVQGAVATSITSDYHMSFRFFVYVAVVGGVAGAFASLAAGLADRWGRANLVVYGSAVSALIALFGIPQSPNKTAYLVWFATLSVVEGVVLVATPALIRDFSPQLGRAVAMAFWTIGPLVGSILVTQVVTHTVKVHPDWRVQFYYSGIFGLAVFVIALFGLRELSPQLRDQLMVSLRDRALIEARARGIDPAAALSGHWKQVLNLRIVASALAFSLMLMIYVTCVSFLVLFVGTTFGYSQERANALGNWYWITSLGLGIATGFLSDRLKVRKPFMLLGALMMATGTALFAQHSTDPTTDYYTLAALLALIAAGHGIAGSAWLACFTEQVEARNPAATATGLAVWGWTLRLVIAVMFVVLASVVSAATPLVDQGPRIQAIATRYASELATAQALDPTTAAALNGGGRPDDATLRAAVGQIASRLHTTPDDAAQRLSALSRVPRSDLAFLQQEGPKVQQAATEAPGQWRNWWWICFWGIVAFLPIAFVMEGRWSPRRAKADAVEHDRLVQAQIRELGLSS